VWDVATPFARSCVHPEGKLLVLYAANAVQIYDVETKEKQHETMLPEAAVFLKWVNGTTLGVVTGSAVFHWALGEATPAKKFDRHPTLAQSQIINYKASADGNWCLLNGIAGGAEGITGQLQLYSVERNVSQPVPAHTGTFATIAADQADMFAFADKAGPGGSVRRLFASPPTLVPLKRSIADSSTMTFCMYRSRSARSEAPARLWRPCRPRTSIRQRQQPRLRPTSLSR